MTTKKITISENDFQLLKNMIAEMSCIRDPDILGYLARLEEEIDSATIIRKDEMPPDIVIMDSTVSFVEEDTGESFFYTLTWPHSADIEQNKISILAPVGMALLGYAVGDTVEWNVPSGRKRFRIEAIRQKESEFI